MTIPAALGVCLRGLLAIALAAVLLPGALSSVALAQDGLGDDSAIFVPASSGAPAVRRAILGLDKSMIVDLEVDISNVTVSNAEILDAVVQTGKRVVLLGKKTGQANAFFFDHKGDRILTLHVDIEQDMSALRRMLGEMFYDAEIEVENANDNLLLRGVVVRPVDANRAAEIAASFVPPGKKVINMLEVRQREQVLLQVTIAEMKRELIKRLGINWSGVRVGDTAFGLGSNNTFPVTGALGQSSFLYGVTGSSDFAKCLVPGLATGTIVPSPTLAGAANGACFAKTLEAFERDGLVRMLAEPKLTAISGEEASFLAGGEFPIPVSQSNDAITVSFKPFGVGLTFTPVVLSEERISLKIATEVSEISTDGAVTVSDISIPGISVRRASTTLELPSGGSLVLAGLLSDGVQKNIDGIPGLKDLPVLGSLFRSSDFRRRETELVVMVTPLIVNPVDPGALSRPDEGLVAPSEDRLFLMGEVNRIYGDPTHPPKGSFRGDVGFIVE